MEETVKSTDRRADPKAKERETKHEKTPAWQNQSRKHSTQITGVTERTKKGEKGVKDMTGEHFLEVSDTAGPPQPGVETETGSCHGPGTRRNEIDPKHLERKAQGRRKDRAGKAGPSQQGSKEAGQRPRRQERSPTWNSAAAKL